MHTTITVQSIRNCRVVLFWKTSIFTTHKHKHHNSQSRITVNTKSIMKFSALVCLAMSTLVVVADEASYLRSRGVECNGIKEKNACLSSTDDSNSEACVWCECQAVPSVCVTKDQADSLPPGVFQCSSSSSPGEFRFQQGKVHNLNENLMDKSDLCDASSKSISGYMDIKGSKYDENGEDKHLFFWMFEKRNSSVDETDEEIPFVVWLTGGPGCSSTLALLTENGPCSVEKDGKSTKLKAN